MGILCIVWAALLGFQASGNLGSGQGEEDPLTGSHPPAGSPSKGRAGVWAASAGRPHSAWLRKLLPLFKSEPGEPFQSLCFSMCTSVIVVWTSDFRNGHIFLMEECKGTSCKIETPRNFASPRLCLDKEKQTKGGVLTQNLTGASGLPDGSQSSSSACPM